MKQKLNKIRSVGIILLLSFLIASCSGNIVFQEAKELPADGWNKDSAAVFNYNSTDTSAMYNIIIDIRNDGNYRYQNFWLFVNSVSPDSISFRDTLECVLADNYGKWIGKGGGTLHQLPVSFMHRIKFPQLGTYSFELKQGMREDYLTGIHDIGLRIERSE